MKIGWNRASAVPRLPTEILKVARDRVVELTWYPRQWLPRLQYAVILSMCASYEV
jgi:hypothetical protein